MKNLFVTAAFSLIASVHAHAQSIDGLYQP